MGDSETASGDEAFRWTAATGMMGLGVLPDFGPNSYASGTNGDGSIVVGESETALFDRRAFIWDMADGIRQLDQFLINSGCNLAGWVLNTAADISDNGKVMVGTGQNPNNSFGDDEAWIAILE